MASVGISSECTAPARSEHTLPEEGAVINIFGASVTVFHWLSLVFSLEMMLPDAVPCQRCTRIRRLHVHIATTVVEKVYPFLCHFVSEHLGNPLCAQLEIGNYSLHSLTRDGNVVCYCLLKNATILLDHFINMISENFVGCCSWSPATLLVIQLT
jgi:hypothetical protein